MLLKPGDRAANPCLKARGGYGGQALPLAPVRQDSPAKRRKSGREWRILSE